MVDFYFLRWADSLSYIGKGGGKNFLTLADSLSYMGKGWRKDFLSQGKISDTFIRCARNQFIIIIIIIIIIIP